MKSQEIDVCICGLMENPSEAFNLDEKFVKNGKNDFKMNNCTRFVRTQLRGSVLLLLGTLDQLMNSFIKPIIPRKQLIECPKENSEHEVYYTTILLFK